jgi:dihydrofolate synthase/folylpolyglutamate synthase
MDMLGNTLSAIAQEKAGIIKDKIPVALGPMSEEPHSTILAIAQQRQARVYEDLPVDIGLSKSLSLHGDYQRENLQTFTCALEALKDLWIPIKRSKVLDGLSNIARYTGLRGRWEVLQSSPLIVADTAHNEPGVLATMSQLIRRLTEQPSGAKLHVVWGMVSDKDRIKILGLLPTNATYYFCKPSVFRGFDAVLLKAEALEMGLVGHTYDSVLSAYEAAKKEAEEHDIIYVGGSTFVVGDLLSSLTKEN